MSLGELDSKLIVVSQKEQTTNQQLLDYLVSVLRLFRYLRGKNDDRDLLIQCFFFLRSEYMEMDIGKRPH